MPRKPIVLVVDDDISVRHWIQDILFEHGYASVAASDAVQGLSVFRMEDIEVCLAIVDMILPGEAGLDLAAELARRQPGLKILYISGCVDSIAMEAIARTHPEVVLLKPLTEESLMDRVQRLMSRPTATSEVSAGTLPKSA